MFNKIIAGSLLVVAVLASVSAYKLYSDYRERAVERLAKMQQKTEEVNLTTIEGWTLNDIAMEVDRLGLVSAKTFLQTAAKFDYSSYGFIDKPPRTTLEGYLFPDTYRIAKNSTAEVIIGKMLSNFTSRVRSAGASVEQETYVIPGYEQLSPKGGDNKPGMSFYDIIVLASIIEKESGGKGLGSGANLSLEDERGLVAGVFYNRMSSGMGLESDATINYATGKNLPAATATDLKVESPYNTYKYSGLPPGPICNPSLGSIKAALRPTKTDYYYFLHKQPSGAVEFSRTFDEHIRKKLAK